MLRFRRTPFRGSKHDAVSSRAADSYWRSEGLVATPDRRWTMDVWVVGRLHYGDEEVIGIFSSEEAARRVCEDQHGNDSSTKFPTPSRWLNGRSMRPSMKALGASRHFRMGNGWTNERADARRDARPAGTIWATPWYTRRPRSV